MNMNKSNGSGRAKGRGVRFALDSTTTADAAAADAAAASAAAASNGDPSLSRLGPIQQEQQRRHRRHKRPRPERPNEDEMDDVDDWNPKEDDDDDADAGIYTERELLHAKRERRSKRAAVASSVQQQVKGEQESQQQAAAAFLEENDNDEDDDDILVDNDDNNDNKKKASTTHINQTTSLAAEGIAIEPFHMDQEKTDGSGYFEGDTYVFRRHQVDEEEPDAWLESLQEQEQQKEETKKDFAQVAAVSANDKEVDETTADDKMDSWSKEELYAKILPLVSDTETVMQAIVRYGNLLRQHRSNNKKPSHPAKESSNSNSSGKPQQQQQQTATQSLAQAALNDLTEAANALLLQGHVDIYEKTRNDLQRLLPEESESPKEKSVAANAASNNNMTIIQWEYQGSQDCKIHGPYTTPQMLAWRQAGYFVGPNAVQVRTVQTKPHAAEEGKTSLQDDLLADLLDDNDDENDYDNSKKKQPPKEELVRGEWQSSDQVNFQEYE